jgi:hypothetical protein
MMREKGTSIYIMDLLCIDHFVLSNFIFLSVEGLGNDIHLLH